LVRKSVESYNPDTKTWTPVADMALCRRNAGMCNIFINISVSIKCRHKGKLSLCLTKYHTMKTSAN